MARQWHFSLVSFAKKGSHLNSETRGLSVLVVARMSGHFLCLHVTRCMACTHLSCAIDESKARMSTSVVVKFWFNEYRAFFSHVDTHP
jgi:hypothetical protein